MKQIATTVTAAVAAVMIISGSARAESCGASASSEHSRSWSKKEAKGGGGNSEQAKGGSSEQKSKDIVDTAVAAGQFKTLAAALKAGGLVETLKGEGPFTVFAPTDDAFKKLPEGTVENLLKPENKDKLKGILTYHVVSGKVMAADAAKLTSAKTVNGKELSVEASGGSVKVGGANVTKADIKAGNGVIHVIDTVLIPSE